MDLPWLSCTASPKQASPGVFQVPVLAERYRAIAPDLRGYGRTDEPAAGLTGC